ncbi:MAG: DUF2752 domain-containing protein [Verrucomicrobia bacterium]|nr:DUF2752 domain-containing protein [Verrucomicrobiota bacterium]
MACVLSLMLLASCLSNLALTLPPCGMRVFTGLPCPLCGSTRCLAALARFEFASALSLNPLTFLVVSAIIVWFLLWLTCPRFRHAGFSWRQIPLFFSFRFWMLLLFSNWAFLCLCLP